MKKAVITSGGKQYLVAEGETIDVELLRDIQDKASFQPLLLIDGDKSFIGQPFVDSVKVDAKIMNADKKQDKVTSIRYKAKKRVRKVRGHRQRLTNLRIESIK
jgi:large subunit ribosomal protein L21